MTLPGSTPAGPPRQLRPTDVKRLNREWRRQTEGRLALILDSVVQPFNVGNIVRTSAAFGAEALWLCGNTPDLDHQSVGKVALGTERFLEVIREPSAPVAVKAASAAGYRVVAIELASGALPLAQAPLEGDICLVIGNEDHGCSPALLAAVDAVGYIPQPSRVGSLNVAIAAGISMAEVRRREWHPGALSCHPIRRHSPLTGSPRSAGKIASVAVPYLDHPRPMAFAHRGGTAHNAENSWRAFEYAAKLGYAYLETDARSTSDGALIAFHDATLDRATDVRGEVSKMTLRQVSAARIGGTEPIPLIEDLLDGFPDLRFNIDLKDSGTVGALAGVLRRTGAWDRVCVTSFSGQRLLAAQRRLDRPICLAVTPAAFTAVRYLGLPGRVLAARLARSGAQCAQVPGLIASREFIRRSHDLGLQVHVWTLNSRAEIERALDLGADGVMTDQLALLRDILTERGQWHPRVPHVKV
jgi:glycerophosphoryl diester phosphodiesterase